ncbi:conserved hypothetical protein [Magnetospirillum sp. LM-5]|uniref:LPS export ABC transporter periplasmic protein LptC n=1 Tax=Magnetospirillum sp. LM-5 TaxID=2681466 RepID=UPI0013842253|nr:LPS export ABC transporter periplasmic protein LptC [Magnetospirillum sp. LM-5]CAA7625505.1 conserved hypothetical protein [Magnetospirillum sp. LM-5]
MDLRAESDLIPPTLRGKVHPVKGPAHRRYSRFVNVMKVALPATTLVLLTLVMVWPKLMRDVESFQIGFAALKPTAVDALSMVNARYQGLDNTNRPYTLTADRATEDSARSGIIILDNPKADFMTRSGANVYVEAKLGIYYQAEKILDLEGEVNLYQDQGNELHTEAARVHLDSSVVEGNAPVTGLGPNGRLSGSGFRIGEGGRQIDLTGRSVLQMKGARRK